jgi:hypothetical protein
MRVGQKILFDKQSTDRIRKSIFYKEQNNPHHYIQGSACTPKKKKKKKKNKSPRGWTALFQKVPSKYDMA